MGAEDELRGNTSLAAGRATSQQNGVVVNVEACRRLATQLSSQAIPLPHEDRSLPRIATGNTNLLFLLAQFRAYDDPVRKKSFFVFCANLKQRIRIER